jgi:ribosome-associated translation inhibitor RaiA
MNNSIINKKEHKPKKSAPPMSQKSVDKELQAYIYQQVSEIEPYLVPNTQVAVLVQSIEEKAKSTDEMAAKKVKVAQPKILVKLVASIAAGEIEAEGIDNDVYQAISNAKNYLIYQIEAINNSEDSEERDTKVRNLINGNYSVH